MPPYSYLDFNFCKVYYNPTHSDNIKFWKNLILKAYSKNQKFFKIKKIPLFKIIFVYSRKEMDKLWGAKTQNYVSGFSKKTKIIIFSPDSIEKYTCWKKSDFYSTLVHEINHRFFVDIVGTSKPLWLSEGVASYVQTNKIKKKLIIPLSLLGTNFNNSGIKAYDYAKQFIRYLIKRYKKEKLIQLIKLIKPNKSNVNGLFKKIYGYSHGDLIKNANAI